MKLGLVVSTGHDIVGVKKDFDHLYLATISANTDMLMARSNLSLENLSF